GSAPSADAVENLSRLLTPGRLHAAFEDGRAVGGAGSFPFELTVPGGRVRAAGVTVVGVLPSHRRRGILRDLMRAQLDDVHERGARETPGMFARSRDWWELRALADPEWRRRGGGEMARAVLEVDGEVEAYALYRLHPAFEHFTSTGRTDVIEALAVSPEATAEIWRFLFDVDWMSRVEAHLLPVDHPLFFLLAEPRRMRFA